MDIGDPRVGICKEDKREDAVKLVERMAGRLGLQAAVLKTSLTALER